MKTNERELLVKIDLDELESNDSVGALSAFQCGLLVSACLIDTLGAAGNITGGTTSCQTLKYFQDRRECG